jgi:hypothetical protein
MVISTAQDLFFLQSSKITTKAFADTILALNSDGMSHVFILQKAGRQNNQLKLTNLTTNTPEEENHQESIFFPDIPGVNQILPYHNNGFFMSNQTHLFLLKDQELQLIYQGLKIDDVTLDICNDLLILIDSGILSQTKIVSSTVETKLKFEKWTKNEVEKEAEMISSHSNTLVYAAKNSQIWHSDGFVLKSKEGSVICSSDPDKSYNVRDIQVFEKSVYMLDAHNLVLWKFDLKDATHTMDEKLCRLEIWKHLESLRQPRDLALLNSVQECISTSTILDSTLTTSISIQPIEHSIEEKQTKENKSSSDDAVSDPCLNYC